MKNLKNKILIISPSEICHNPRLIKAADCYHNNGFEVIVWNIVSGSADPKLHEQFPNRKAWKIVDYNISKKTKLSYWRWLSVSLINVLVRFLWDKFRWDSPLNRAYLNKGALGFSNRFTFQYIHTNVIDLLPLASQIKANAKAKLIFDAQEFFSGQFESENPNQLAWVQKMEKKHLKEVDLMITTTTVLAELLREKYQLNQLPVRVRNLPSDKHSASLKVVGKPMKLIWHGFTIHLYSRGIHILLQAVKLCKTQVNLYIQGRISANERQKIEDFLGQEQKHLVSFKPPADPEAIVESLNSYDIGLIGEQPLNPNQLYTSSNKLFDYIHAGLPVISSNMPGIIETISTYQVGEIYDASNAQELADKIDMLNENPEVYQRYASNSIDFASKINWVSDFEAVLEKIKH